MLKYGYNRGLPEGTETAWGCRAIIAQNGYVDAVWDRSDLVGPDRVALADHLTHHVRAAWCDRAGELLRNGVMHTRRAEEFTLYEDATVVIKGNTNASAGHLYVCAYLRPRCEAFARRGTGTGSCGQPLDEHGQCPRASGHIQDGA